MNKHLLAGRKQIPGHSAKRVASVRKTKEAWTEDRHRLFCKRASKAAKNRDPIWLVGHRGIFSKGTRPWNKGKKCPQLSGSNHGNYGNKMPEEHKAKLLVANLGKKQSPELIKKRVDARAGYKHSVATKAKIRNANRGEGNGSWKGGMSHEPYTVIWASKRFKNGIRERDNHTCQNPDCRKNSNILNIHHIDYDKKNCEPENLITLCRSCNARANFNREFWEAGYKAIIRTKYQVDNKQIAV